MNDAVGTDHDEHETIESIRAAFEAERKDSETPDMSGERMD